LEKPLYFVAAKCRFFLSSMPWSLNLLERVPLATRAAFNRRLDRRIHHSRNAVNRIARSPVRAQNGIQMC